MAATELEVLQKPPEPLQLELPVQEPPKTLHQRVEELLNKPLKMSAPKGAISAVGIKRIQSYLRNNGLPYPHLPDFSEDSALDPKLQFHWSWTTTRGTLPKRLGKWLRAALQDPRAYNVGSWVTIWGRTKEDGSKETPADYFKRVVTPELLSEVGNIARQNSEDSTEYFFDLVDRVDWGRNDFGQSSSCWWSDDSEYGGLQAYQDKGGLAARFFSQNSPRQTGYGVGRAWVVRDHISGQQVLSVFNGYWSCEGATLKIARVLAAYLGLSYKRVDMDDAQGFYINGDLAYLLAPEEVLSEVSRWSMPFDKYASSSRGRRPLWECDSCGDDFRTEANWDGDSRYCDGCWANNSTYCPRCDTTQWDPDGENSSIVRQSNHRLGCTWMRESSYLSETWCDSCTEQHASRCSECDEFYADEDISEVEDQSVCFRCLPDLPACENCNEKVLSEDSLTEVEGEMVCDGCAEQAAPCVHCDKETLYTADETDEGEAVGDSICQRPECLQRRAESAARTIVAEVTTDAQMEMVLDTFYGHLESLNQERV